MINLPAFDSLSAITGWFDAMPAFDKAAADAARDRQAQLTKPPGSLGRLEELAVFMAGWHGDPRPRVMSAQSLVFAGNHGICCHGVNPFPQEVTTQMVTNFERGGAAINQLARAAGATLSVVALDLERPTADFTTGPAMSEEECLDSMRHGAEAVDPAADVILLGEMGIGNSTVAAALAHACFGGEPGDWVGRGTGADDERVALKSSVVAKGRQAHADATGLGILAALGGREQAAICGAVLAARAARIPVLLDGFICSASAAPLYAAAPALLDHCIVSHASAEPGHARLCAALGKSPLLDLGMALGEGTGAALALSILRGALECHNGMATFAEAGIGGA
ncbi:nicotinate-nucleotide--dimethylbenzimidazole phosphoribosyltransferase [Roseivivax halodurans JCM 10272]|uniref:Nicotinate-nucleotide--dimethylbenzimidazole phosphoribosyltransferase n=1 Tax=Roseivivax halodurans JCM 10272 TaxID=1449350 RepID=X7EEY3_9RHOB|nr:nicotinate-nucleotide--dimethylbenzimidazole phosphoribosyltransferase [Roseivivax halodurans]ETX13693.1 nicotinate-nucleotide--dimethylbenzimidazole phosphoribosyltransferase [Roseivivax halodurans JCM 10272]